MATTDLHVGMRCIKYLLCAVNAVFMLTGIMAILIGLKTLNLFSDFYFLLVPAHGAPCKALVIVGVLTFVIAFLGCYGVIKESTCMVLLFAVSLSIVLVLEIVAGVAAFALRDGVTIYLYHAMWDMMEDYKSNADIAKAVDFVQTTLHCCGFHGPSDWEYIMKYSVNQIEEQTYPDSCYVVDTTRRHTLKVDETGCMSKLSMLVHQSALDLGTAVVAIALIQLTGIIFACTLGRAIRRQKTNRELRRWELRQNLIDGYRPLGKSDPQFTFPVIYTQPEFPAKTPVVQ